MRYSNLVKRTDEILKNYGYKSHDTEIKRELIELAEYYDEIIEYYIEIIEDSYNISNKKTLLLLEILAELGDKRSLSYISDVLSASSKLEIDTVNSVIKISEKMKLSESIIRDILGKLNWDNFDSWNYRQMVYEFCKVNYIDGILNKIAEMFLEGNFSKDFSNSDDNIRIEILNFFLSTDYALTRFLPRLMTFFSEGFVFDQDGGLHCSDLNWEILRFISKVGNEAEIPFYMKVFYKLKQKFENELQRNHYEEHSSYDDEKIKSFTLTEFFEEYHIFHSILTDLSKKLGFSSARNFILDNSKKYENDLQKIEEEKNKDRISKLKNLNKISTEISLIKLAKILEFDNDDELLKWIAGLNIKSSYPPFIFENENLVFLKEGQPKGEYSCFYCNNKITRKTQVCSECDEDVLVCCVCKLPINYAEKAGQCSLCEAKGHLNHLEEHVKVYGKCPVCQRKIPPEGITPYFTEGSW